MEHFIKRYCLLYWIPVWLGQGHFNIPVYSVYLSCVVIFHSCGGRTHLSFLLRHSRKRNEHHTTKYQPTNYRTKRTPSLYLLQYSILFSVSGIYSYLHLLNGSELVAAGTEIQNSLELLRDHFWTEAATSWRFTRSENFVNYEHIRGPMGIQKHHIMEAVHTYGDGLVYWCMI